MASPEVIARIRDVSPEEMTVAKHTKDAIS